jgi:hypothetical protein
MVTAVNRRDEFYVSVSATRDVNEGVTARFNTPAITRTIWSKRLLFPVSLRPEISTHHQDRHNEAPKIRLIHEDTADERRLATKM